MTSSTPSTSRTPSPRPLALVTGASSGIGAALVHELAARGCRVAASARRAGTVAFRPRAAWALSPIASTTASTS